MVRKITLWLLWAGFIVYAFLLTPERQAASITLLKNLFTLQWAAINPIILSIFALIGILLLIYSCVLFIDGRMQKIPFWPFVAAGAGTGVIGLIPYLALRESNQTFSGDKDAFLKLMDSRWTGVILSLNTLALLAFGWLAGDWGDFVRQFHSSRFVNAMTVAFCLFCVLFPTVLGDDMARRGIKDQRVFWAVALVPLLGPLVYLCLRPPLSVSTDAGVRQASAATLS